MARPGIEPRTPDLLHGAVRNKKNYHQEKLSLNTPSDDDRVDTGCHSANHVVKLPRLVQKPTEVEVCAGTALFATGYKFHLTNQKELTLFNPIALRTAKLHRVLAVLSAIGLKMENPIG